jgi:DNA primase
MTLSKHDIAEYYSDPHVREAILEQVKGRGLLAIMDRGEEKITRRNAPDGQPIRITEAKGDASNKADLAWYTDRRFAEFHPSIGKNTRMAWVDIDPGHKVPFEDVKKVTLQVANKLKELPEVEKARITYSGGRGFHVRGDLYRKMPTDQVREIVNTAMRSEAKGVLTMKPPGPDQIRLDTSTLHNMGSLRAEYSLNSETGRVAVPLTERELRGFKPEHADLKRVLAQKEFAPGIPRSRRTYPMSTGGEGKHWMMVMQEHHADRAGKHWDLRLIDPDTSYAHSWAVPKSKFPAAGEKLLAVRTPTHTAHYSLNFGAKGPQQIGKGYGKGTVEIVAKEPVLVEKVTDESVKFKRLSDNQSYTIFRTHNDKWLLQQGKPMEKAAQALGYYRALSKYALEGSEMQQKGPDSEAVANLTGALERMQQPDPVNEEERNKNQTFGTSAAERRLNTPVSWSMPVSDTDYGQGAPYNTMRGRSYG